MTKIKCGGCGKEIPKINLEFGGAYYNLDGDPFCNKQCHDQFCNRITSVCKSEESVVNYIRGKNT